MRWYSWPVAALAVMMGTNAYGGHFGRNGNVVQNEVQPYAGMTDNTAQAPTPNYGSSMPSNGANCNCRSSGSFGSTYANPGNANGGGFMGISWASGCCQQSTCCDNVWDNYQPRPCGSHHCGMKKHWHNCTNQAGCNSCGSGCANQGNGNRCFSGCGGGFASGGNSGCSSGCNTGGCGSTGGGFHHKMHGFALSCFGSTTSADSSGSCGCTGSSSSVNPSIQPPIPTDSQEGLISEPTPIVNPEEAPTPAPSVKRSPDIETPAPANLDKETKVPVKQTGKTAFRPWAILGGPAGGY